MLDQVYAALDLSSSAAIALAVIILGAAIVRGLTGFGFAILAVPLMGLVVPPTDAVLLAILLQTLIGPFGVSKALDHIDRKLVTSVALFAMIGTPIGLFVLAATPHEMARLMIAGIALACFGTFLIKRAPTPNPAMAHRAATGLAAGFLNGFAAMPGPPVILYFVRSGVTPMAARGSMILVFFAAGIAGTTTAALRGLLTSHLLLVAAAAFPMMLLGNHIGARFFGIVPERIWRATVVVLLCVATAGALTKLQG
ncbi:MAG: sulfite exporter TauE/SafE family protein [Chakrabartia sp.]